MKYIMFLAERENVKRKIPIVFPNELIHSEVAEHMLHLFRFSDDWQLWDVRAVNAGTYAPGSGKVGGDSETLKLKSDPADELIIWNYDYSHGVV